MSVKRILVVCIVVALLYSTVNPISENLVGDATKNPLNYSESASDLEMKLQLPGSIWEDDSVIDQDVDMGQEDFDDAPELQDRVPSGDNDDDEDDDGPITNHRDCSADDKDAVP